MTGEFAAAGDVVTAALIARAVDGGHDGGANAVPAQCLNCGTALVGAHCHQCGQPGHVHRSLAAIWHDLAHGVFHFEGKVFRTLPLLVFKPGQLTRRYIDGERTRFVSPLALFLFTVFLMFGMISLVGGEISPPNLNPEARQEALRTMDAQLTKATGALDRIDKQRAEAVAAGRDTAEIDRERAVLRTSITGLERAAQELKDGNTPVFTDFKTNWSGTGWQKLDKGIAKANANPGLLIYKLQSSAYKFSWALIPLSVPFVALLFLWRRGHHFYDHTVFVTFSLCFMMLLVIVLTLAGIAGVPSGIIGTLAMIAPPLHMYKQLRHTYRLRRFSAMWRLVFLLSFSTVVLTLFGLLLLGMGLLG